MKGARRQIAPPLNPVLAHICWNDINIQAPLIQDVLLLHKVSAFLMSIWTVCSLVAGIRLEVPAILVAHYSFPK